MDKLNLPKFYELGAALKPLTQLDPSKPPGNDPINQLFALFTARFTVVQLLADYPELHYCRAAGDQLGEFVNRWYESWRANQSAEEPVAYDVTIEFIINHAKKLEHLLLEELQGESVFRITQTGMYSTIDLIERAEKDFPGSTRAKLRPQIVAEIRECGKCLAFDVPTAAGFHILRALELVMLDYYIAVCNPTPPPDRLDYWGFAIVELRKVSDPALPNPTHADVAKAVALLQQIKDDDRNFIMHPERVLDADEALGLFKLCQAAMIAMAPRLSEPEPEPEVAQAPEQL